LITCTPTQRAIFREITSRQRLRTCDAISLDNQIKPGERACQMQIPCQQPGQLVLTNYENCALAAFVLGRMWPLLMTWTWTWAWAWDWTDNRMEETSSSGNQSGNGMTTAGLTHHMWWSETGCGHVGITRCNESDSQSNVQQYKNCILNIPAFTLRKISLAN